MNRISERLKLLRGSVSQQKFAESIGLKQTTYGQYERGVTSPSTETASLICRNLGLNPRWLILGEEPMYDAEASQERLHLMVGDIKDKDVDELPSDIQKPIKKVMKAIQAWRQRWDELPDWAKEYIQELEKELTEAKAAEARAKDEALKAKDEALAALKTALAAKDERQGFTDVLNSAPVAPSYTRTNR